MCHAAVFVLGCKHCFWLNCSATSLWRSDSHKLSDLSEVKLRDSFFSSELSGQRKLVSLEILRCQNTFRAAGHSLFQLLPINLTLKRACNFIATLRTTEDRSFRLYKRLTFSSSVIWTLFMPVQMKAALSFVLALPNSRVKVPVTQKLPNSSSKYRRMRFSKRWCRTPAPKVGMLARGLRAFILNKVAWIDLDSGRKSFRRVWSCEMCSWLFFLDFLYIYRLLIFRGGQKSGSVHPANPQKSVLLVQPHFPWIP